MRFFSKTLLVLITSFAGLLLLHLPVLRLPYFWDEAGYYIPAALDFYHSWLLIPASTLHTGHTPLVMIYLALVWRLFGYSAFSTRTAMTLIAAAAITALYALARRVATREIALWSALLLALSPIFFAQSTLAHLDLTAALFTTLAILFLLGEERWLFALSASLAFLSKETAVVLLPAVWLCEWRWKRTAKGRRALLATWGPLVVPLVPLAGWALYYHHVTGYWTGNREYLTYNLYSTLNPARVFLTLMRRAYELFVGGFNWLLTEGAAVGIWWGQKYENRKSKFEARNSPPCSNFEFRFSRLAWLTVGLVTIYLLMLSVVGGAVLPRYLLPVFPLFYLAGVGMVTRLPRYLARLILAAIAGCLVWAWFINPPYPFPFEDNLSYADFIRLHEQAAQYLEALPGRTRILTAWPATDELAKPELGYVQRPLRIVTVQGFALRELTSVPPESFDLLYFYSRQWEPPGNWLARVPTWLQWQRRYFDYQPQTAAEVLAARYHLRLRLGIEQRGQWVRIYSR